MSNLQTERRQPGLRHEPDQTAAARRRSVSFRPPYRPSQLRWEGGGGIWSAGAAVPASLTPPWLPSGALAGACRSLSDSSVPARLRPAAATTTDALHSSARPRSTNAHLLSGFSRDSPRGLLRPATTNANVKAYRTWQDHLDSKALFNTTSGAGQKDAANLGQNHLDSKHQEQ